MHETQNRGGFIDDEFHILWEPGVTHKNPYLTNLETIICGSEQAQAQAEL
jgi:hypothetical protein